MSYTFNGYFLIKTASTHFKLDFLKLCTTVWGVRGRRGGSIMPGHRIKGVEVLQRGEGFIISLKWNCVVYE